MAIEKGSRAAWATRALLEAWEDVEGDSWPETLRRIRPLYPDVLHHLMIVTSGIIQTVATLAGQSYEELRGSLWAQMAADPATDDAAGRLMRAAITAWMDSEEAAEALNASGAFAEVDPDDQVMPYLAVTTMLLRRIEKAGGPSQQESLTGIWSSLGTEGNDPFLR